MRAHPRFPHDPPVTWRSVLAGFGLLAAFFGFLVALEYPAAAGVAASATVLTALVVRRALRGAVPVPGTDFRLRVSVERPDEATYEWTVALDRTRQGRTAA